MQGLSFEHATLKAGLRLKLLKRLDIRIAGVLQGFPLQVIWIHGYSIGLVAAYHVRVIWHPSLHGYLA